MRYIFTLIYLLACYNFSSAQTVVGTKNPSSSAILNTINSKSFIPPKVTIGTNLFDNLNPVNNPAEGLIVYNTGTNQLPGYYIWQNSTWNLLGTENNSVSSAIIRFNAGVLDISTVGNYVPLIGGTKDFDNIIVGLSYNATTGLLKIPEGNYNVLVTLNLKTAETVANGLGVGTIRTHAHFYSAKLESAGGNLGGIVYDNATSNPNSVTNGQQHQANFSFSFNLTTPASFIFKLAHEPRGSYNGSVTALNGTFIHIWKSVQ